MVLINRLDPYVLDLLASIAITDFYSNDTSTQKIGKNISKVISDNLERSGLFFPIDNMLLIAPLILNEPPF